MVQIITIQYNDLLSFDFDNPSEVLVTKIGQAFGSSSDCLGILAVEGVPKWMEHRERLLPLAARLPGIPSLDKVVLPDTKFSTGWSHGREMLGDQPDIAKGSFYANPNTNHLVADLCMREPEKTDHWEELGKRHPEFYADNVWPEDDLPELESAFMEVGQLVRQVGILLAGVCDVYCRQQGVETDLKGVLSGSLNTKGRLLHYFDMSGECAEGDKDKMWCGWHNDHVRGALRF